MTRSLALAASLALALTIVAPAAAATLCVNPGGTGGCFASIQDAIDASASRDTIDIAAGTYVDTVYLTNVGRLTIRGAGPGATIIDNPPGVLTTVSTFGLVDVTISGVALRNGGAGIFVGDYGKFLLRDCSITGYSSAALTASLKTKVTIEDCLIAGNGESGIVTRRAAVGSRGTTLRVVRSDIRDNTGSGIGTYGRADVVDSTIRDNGRSGVEASTGSLIGSTVSGNGQVFPLGGVSFGDGRGGSVKITRSTISGNHGIGVAIADRSGVRFDQVTIAGNVDPDSPTGGIYTVSARVSAKSTIVADNLPNDCFSMFPDYEVAIRLAGVNLIETPAGCTLLGAAPIVADPLLGPLQNNGGPTETQALLAGSPAIGVRAAGCSGVDQRGQPRTKPCDIGSYETP